MSKLIDVRVTTVTAELNLIIPPKSTGKTLFDKIILTLGLQETWYFGIVYVDEDGYHRWLKMNKQIMRIKVRDKKLMKFNFLVKYYPEDVADELIQNITISLFYFQARENILRGDIFCPPETALLLASLSFQVKFGDYDPEIHKPGSFLQDRMLPDRILNQYRWSTSQWEETIIKWYSEHNGMFPEEAMLEYLKLTQDLEMYGVTYFLIRNKKGSCLYLGVDAMGMNIYKYSDRLTPQIGFPWNEIRSISYNDRRFVIKSIDKNSPDFLFYTQEKNVNKNILAICSGNHELSVRRRNGDSIAVKQMKDQALHEKVKKAREREQLLKEIQSKEEVRQKLQLLEERLKAEKLELAKANKSMESCLENYNDVFKKLEQKDVIGRLETSLVNHIDDNIRKDNENIKTRDYVAVTKKENIVPRRDEVDNPRTSIKVSVASISFDIEGNVCNLEKKDELGSLTEKRQTIMEVNLSLQDRRRELEADLESVKIPKPVDEFDAIHLAKKSQGLDKFQTLKQIRLGNTKKRVDAFESL